MFAVMLIFAFAMSLIINLAERMIREYTDDKALEPDTDEMLLTKNTKEITDSK